MKVNDRLQSTCPSLLSTVSQVGQESLNFPETEEEADPLEEWFA